MTKESGMGFNGMTNGNNGGYNSKYQHKAAGIPTAKENYGRGPTKAGTTGDTVPNPTANKGKINGGTTVASSMKGNYGRGPTKGNCAC